MTSSITKIALCTPTGKLGPSLLESLVGEGLDVTVVVRESSKAIFPTSQKIVKVGDDYSQADLTKAFSGQDAVVLSLPFELLAQGKKFSQASIDAGTRWLIASTYGSNLEDPQAALFPASVPHIQAVEELKELQKGQTTWAWTAISCGPWPEISVAAGAWHIDTMSKKAELVDGGTKVFTTTTRKQLGIAIARILKKQPTSMRNKNVYVSSFEVDMLTWLDAHKQVVGTDGWEVKSVDGKTMIEQSKEHLAKGQFVPGYTKAALVTCTGQGFENQFSKFATLINQELELPEENVVDVVRDGLSLPNPFGDK